MEQKPSNDGDTYALLITYHFFLGFGSFWIPIPMAPRHVSARSITKRCWGEGWRSRALMAAQCGWWQLQKIKNLGTWSDGLLWEMATFSVCEIYHDILGTNIGSTTFMMAYLCSAAVCDVFLYRVCTSSGAMWCMGSQIIKFGGSL